MPKALKLTLIILAVIAVVVVTTFLTYSGVNAFKKVDIIIAPDTPIYYYNSGGSYIRILNDTAFIKGDTGIRHYDFKLVDGNLIELTPTDTADASALKGVFINPDTIYLSQIRCYFYKEQ